MAIIIQVHIHVIHMHTHTRTHARMHTHTHTPEDLSRDKYCGTQILMATTSLLDTRGSGNKNWLKITVPGGSSVFRIVQYQYQ